MTRNRNHVQHPSAQVVLDYLVRPARDAKEVLDRLHVRLYERRARHGSELLVAGCVVAVSMSVCNHQRNGLPLVPPEPGVNHNTYVAAYFGLTCASVQQ